MGAETSGTTSPPAGALGDLAARAGQVLAEEAEGRGLRIGLDRSDITASWVPGAIELPLVARALARAGADAVVCLGAVVRGETASFEHVAGERAAGVQREQLDEGEPVAFGDLTTETVGQALARSGPDGTNEGGEAAATAVETARLLRMP